MVFIGPYEHHSNELPWRESIADVVTIHEDADGHIDVDQLRAELERYADRPLRIGSFSAASNVTGIVTDTHAITRLLHEHGALALWDFAACAPYVDIEMNPRRRHRWPARTRSSCRRTSSSAAPARPGVLAVSRRLLTNSVPDVVGGGTVAYVNPTEHLYVTDPAHREEGGTPAIVESIRAGLVFALKDAVGVATIRAHEEDFLRRAVTAWHEHPAIEVLGNPDAERLSIVSFVVRRPGGRYLHHNLVVSILNDLFGIQSRGGCSCAGPYGHRLLGIDLDRSHEFEREIAGGCEGIKPGWVRINFNYFVSEAGLRVRRPRGRPRRRPRPPAGAAVPLRPDDRPVAAPRRSGRAAAAADPPLLRRRRRAHLPAPARHRPRVRAGRLPRRGRGAVRRRCPRSPARTASATGSAPTSSSCAGSTCRRCAWSPALRTPG